MFSFLKKKIVMSFLTVAVVGSVSATTFSILQNSNTVSKESNASNINDVTMDLKETPKKDQNSNILTDAKKTNSVSSNTKIEKSNHDVKKVENPILKQENISTSSIVKQEVPSLEQEKEKFVVEVKAENNKSSETIKEEVTNPSNFHENVTSTEVKEINKINAEMEENINDIVEAKVPTISYDRTTSIYENDNVTLLRVEYYVNNKLTYYSVIDVFDAKTKSYIEKIYQCNLETNIDPLIRTDEYVNGNLIKSY